MTTPAVPPPLPGQFLSRELLEQLPDESLTQLRSFHFERQDAHELQARMIQNIISKRRSMRLLDLLDATAPAASDEPPTASTDQH